MDKQQEEKVQALEARVRFLEEVLSIPSQTYACQTNPDDCPIRKNEADGCVRVEGKVVCPLTENKLDNLIMAFHELRTDVDWPTSVLREMANHGYLDVAVVELAELRIGLHREIENLAVRRGRLARFKRKNSSRPFVGQMEKLVKETENRVMILSKKAERHAALLEAKAVPSRDSREGVVDEAAKGRRGKGNGRVHPSEEGAGPI